MGKSLHFIYHVAQQFSFRNLFCRSDCAIRYLAILNPAEPVSED